ncbi:hypothetical protein PR048_007058 [Dryococelus australis]|uniref:Uncharacterized protein n=1 Tax=Dryococelus australis TaxID=614101 RepID=A0ABQ9ICK3_9NEOP|nr:hypothetical protein PR048_007058 [Dryococelus australis]
MKVTTYMQIHQDISLKEAN